MCTDSAAGRRAESLLLALAFVLVNLAGARFQPQITEGGSLGWEGVDYHAVAAQLLHGVRPLTAEGPTVYRVGTPALAALVARAGWAGGGDLVASFRTVNLLANALTLGLWVAWLRRFVGDWRVRTALGLGWLLQWDTPTRWLWFDPVHTDPGMWVFLLAGLLAVDGYRRRPTPTRLVTLTLLASVGVLFREVVLVVPLALLFVDRPFRRDSVAGRWAFRLPRPVLFVPLAVASGSFTALHASGLVRPTDGYSFARTAVHWLYDKPPPTYAHAWLAAFGPAALALPLFCWRQTRTFLAERQDLAVYLGAFAALGYLGGTDTERLLYWTAPVIFILVGRAVEGNRATVLGSPALVAVLVGVQLVASRAVFWPIPDHPGGATAPHALSLLTPFARRVPFLDLFSFFAPREVEFRLLLSNLACLALLLGWLWWRRPRAVVHARAATARVAKPAGTAI